MCVVEKTTQDYEDAAKETPQTHAGVASDEPDPVTKPHRKAKAHDLEIHNHVVNEDSDGALGNAIAGGIINTGEADAKLASYSSTSKKKEKEKEDLLRLIHILEAQIERLKKEVAGIREQIRELDVQISTKEELLEALWEGRELTEAQEKLAEKYRDKDGNIDQAALVHDIDDDKDKLQELNERANEIDRKIEDKTNLLNSLNENTPPEKVDEILKEISTEGRETLYGETENQKADKAAIEELADKNDEYATFLEEGLLGDDDLMTYDSPGIPPGPSVASLVSKTPIEGENITVAYNNAASGEDNNARPENEIVVKIENVMDRTV